LKVFLRLAVLVIKVKDVSLRLLSLLSNSALL
jgi:hypothetical protein